MVEPNISKINISKININTDVLDMFQSQVQDQHVYNDNMVSKREDNQIYDIKDIVEMLAVGKVKYYPKTNNIGN